MLYPVIACYGFIWWVLAILTFILVVNRLLEEGKLSAFLWGAFGCAVLVLFSDAHVPLCLHGVGTSVNGFLSSIYHFATENSMWLLGLGGFYVLAGTIWSLFKWFLLAHDWLESYEETKVAWLEKAGIVGIKEIPDRLKDSWKQHLLSRSDWSRSVKVRKYDPITGLHSEEYVSVLKIKPVAWEHKGQIVSWMMFWPLSLVYALFHDLVRRLFKAIQRMVSSLMDRIASFVFRSTEKDFNFHA